MSEAKFTEQDMYIPKLINGRGGAPILLICEHASNYIPSEFQQLGLSSEAVSSHAAWDPGALDVACQMAQKLDAPLISASVSRLLYDCNRPVGVPDAIPAKSELYEVPGNQNLSEDIKRDRVQRIYEPFQNFIQVFLNENPKIKAILTVHSFTPVYNGQPRSVEIGLLHDIDSRFAETMKQRSNSEGSLQIRLNEPYSAQDGVTHTLKEHGIKRGLLNAMIEVKNDLIADAMSVENISNLLANWSENALHDLGVSMPRRA